MITGKHDYPAASVFGDVHIILSDDATLKIDQGMRMAQNSSISFYSQSSDPATMGTLKTDLIGTSSNDYLTITFNGGNIIVNQTQTSSAAIGSSSGQIYINGGVLDISSSYWGGVGSDSTEVYLNWNDAFARTMSIKVNVNKALTHRLFGGNKENVYLSSSRLFKRTDTGAQITSERLTGNPDHWNYGPNTAGLNGVTIVPDSFRIDFHAGSFPSGEMKSVYVSRNEDGSVTYKLPEASFPSPPAAYEVTGWRINAGLKYSVGDTVTIPADADYIHDSSVTFYAEWSLKADYVRVEFDKGEGGDEYPSLMNTRIVKKNESFTLPECKFIAPSDKVFDKWRVDGTTTTYADKATISVAENTKLIALWKDKPATCTVRYIDPRDNSVLWNRTGIPYNTSIEDYQLTDTFSTLDGWYDSSNWDTATKYIFPLTVTGDLNLYAKWVYKPDLNILAFDTEDNLITQAFNPSGGAAPGGSVVLSPESAADKETVTVAETPAEGYMLKSIATLMGSTETPVSGSSFKMINNKENRISKVIVSFKQKSCTVTFDPQGGSPKPANQIIGYGNTAKQPPNPKKPGFQFTGWYTDAACTGKYDFGMPVTDDLPLYAGWTDKLMLSLSVITIDADGTILSEIGGTASLDPTNPVKLNDLIKVTAIPNMGFVLDRVNYGDGLTIGTDITSSMQFNVENDKYYVDVFFRKIRYITTSGDGQVWIRGQYNPAKFTVERSIENAAAFSHFTGIWVDGKTVPASDYTAASGSVKLEISFGYLESLKDGNHTLTTLFDDGEATAQFTIKPSPGHMKADASHMPKTGDGSRQSAWLVLSLTCLTGLAVMNRKRRRG